jgi:hypothetical protein
MYSAPLVGFYHSTTSVSNTLFSVFHPGGMHRVHLFERSEEPTTTLSLVEVLVEDVPSLERQIDTPLFTVEHPTRDYQACRRKEARRTNTNAIPISVSTSTV